MLLEKGFSTPVKQQEFQDLIQWESAMDHLIDNENIMISEENSAELTPSINRTEKKSDSLLDTILPIEQKSPEENLCDMAKGIEYEL